MVTILNVIIDIYADEDRDYDRPVFVEGRILQGLTGLVRRVRTQVSLVRRLGQMPMSAHDEKVRNIDKHKARGLRLRAEEAYDNLAAFIKYRRNLCK